MWWCIGALLPVSVLYVQGMGALAPVYVVGAAVLVPLLVLRTIAGGTIAPPPRSYFVLVALTLYVLLLDVVRGQAPSPNAGNLVVGALAPLLVFSTDVSSRSFRAVRAGAWAALGIVAVDRILQFAGYQAPSPLTEVVDPSLSYYRYKASYVAGDANSVGLFLFPLFALLYWTAPRRSRSLAALEYALQAATLSKASIGALLVRDLLKNTAPKAVRGGGAVALVVGLVYVVTTVDIGRAFDSGLVKLQTSLMFLEAMYASNAGALALGHGNNSALGLLGIYLHAWPMTAAYETGLVGLALVIWYLIESFRESRRIFMMLHFPIFCVAGWSFLFYLGSMWLYLPHYALLALETARVAGDEPQPESDASLSRHGPAGEPAA